MRRAWGRLRWIVRNLVAVVRLGLGRRDATVVHFLSYDESLTFESAEGDIEYTPNGARIDLRYGSPAIDNLALTLTDAPSLTRLPGKGPHSTPHDCCRRFQRACGEGT